MRHHACDKGLVLALKAAFFQPDAQEAGCAEQGIKTDGCCSALVLLGSQLCHVAKLLA